MESNQNNINKNNSITDIKDISIEAILQYVKLRIQDEDFAQTDFGKEVSNMNVHLIKYLHEMYVMEVMSQGYISIYPQLSDEIRDMVIINENKNSIPGENNLFEDGTPSMDNVFPVAKSRFSDPIYKMFELAFHSDLPPEHSLAQFELASSCFLEDILFEYGEMIDRRNYLFSIVNNYPLLGEGDESILRYESKELVAAIEQLKELNAYYILINYESPKSRNNNKLFMEFNPFGYKTAVCTLVERIATLVYKS